MGTWGFEPWESDGAKEWFAVLFKAITFDHYLQEAFENPDNYDEIRAACHLLAGLGLAEVWPGDLNTLNTFLMKGVQLLTRMIEPAEDDEDNSFLKLWDNDLDVIRSVRSQIVALQERLEQLREHSVGMIPSRPRAASEEDAD